jgi:predicted transcriptional regulator
MDIGEWYDKKRKELDLARKALDEAKAAGASPEILAKLERACERAAYVGD